MQGFIFSIKTKDKTNYYFIESNKTRKTKADAQKILDYLVNVKYKDCGFIPLNVINNTFNKIFTSMVSANIKLSNDNSWYYIHEQYAGATVPATDITIISAMKGGE